MEKIKVGILGYGNLGRGAEEAVSKAEDMELGGIYTRRSPQEIRPLHADTAVFPAEELDRGQRLDVLIMCGGSAADLPWQTPKYAEKYNVVDSFDNHSQIPVHFAAVNAAAKRGGRTAIISTGWDPGLFSLMRACAAAVLPDGESCTFWGKGISQGHSDAIRRISGVKDARQYTVPSEKAVSMARAGKPGFSALTPREKHLRQCFVVPKDGCGKEERAAIEEKIKTMPAYFADYDTEVNFITEEELLREHGGMPHAGTVIGVGHSGPEGKNRSVLEFKLTLDSNPQFTASVLTAYARAVHRLYLDGRSGCATVLDVPLSYLLPMKREEMIKAFL